MEESSWYHAAPLLNLVEMLAGDFPGVRFSFFSTPRTNKCLFKPDAGGELNIKAYDVWGKAAKGAALLPGREAAMRFVEAMPANYERAVEEAMVAAAWRRKKGDRRIAIAARNKMEIKELVCSHCGKTGHEIEACYKLIGYPEGETLEDDGSSSPAPADHYDDDDNEVMAEEQLDRPQRNGQPEEGGKAVELPAVDPTDRSHVHGRPSSRQKGGTLGDQPTVDSVDRLERHGGPFEGQRDRLQGDEETVDRDDNNGRPSPRQKGGSEEPSQTVDPVDRSTDGGRPSSSRQPTETLGRGQRERRPNDSTLYM
ncbi:unnamed protein product [Cuscuta campestris]|uniref:CCHC-type domain-containing protein n=1 Tax=Cuscuta campestris TaxID=132261 RepID=A0A484KHG9_9ASTE|nr:unnamed protein product [Cuscuta campestris]